jgi:hypothetical protein
MLFGLDAEQAFRKAFSGQQQGKHRERRIVNNITSNHSAFCSLPFVSEGNKKRWTSVAGVDYRHAREKRRFIW